MLTDLNAHRAAFLRILKVIYSDPVLATSLGFKGGSAALLFYGLDRFSVDLDFDLLEDSREEDVYQRLSALLPELGIVREQYKKYHTLFFLLSYQNEAHNVKVEISRRKSGSRYEQQDYLGIAMLVQKQEDMFANKLVAMCERKKQASRDIYDVWFFLNNNWPINETIVEQRGGMAFNDYLKKAVGYLEHYDDKFILQGLGELLDAKQKAWVKGHLKQEAIFLLKLRLEP